MAIVDRRRGGVRMQVHLFGVRGSLPTPGPAYLRYGGNTSCVGIGTGGGPPRLVLDFGTGARNLAARLGSAPFRGTVLLGHLHWDHILAIPFFPPADRPEARVRLYMPDQGDPVAALERPMSPPAFPISPTSLRGDWSFHALTPGEHEFEGLRVTALDIPHSGGRTFGYRIEEAGTAVAYISDHSPTSLGPGPDGLGAYHEAAVRLASGADLLIHDSQYTPEEFAVKSDWGHCMWQYPIGLANHSGTRRVLLSHHDPGHDDDFLDAIATRLPRNAALAVEGTIIEV
jgi:phosphoribosyl 1,2-cyclic phosphodiesterase